MRLGKIFTDLPLVVDPPKKFGVREFCDVCQLCSSACPPKAIPKSPPSAEVMSISNILGVVKWTTNAERCFKFWASQNSDCSICIRVCPYNRDYTRWYNRLWRRLAGTHLRKLMLWVDLKLVDRRRRRSEAWWQR